MRFGELHAVDAIADAVRNGMRHESVGVRVCMHRDAHDSVNGAVDAGVVRIEIVIAKIEFRVRIHFVDEQVRLICVSGAMAILDPDRSSAADGKSANRRIDVGRQRLASFRIFIGALKPQHLIVRDARNAFHIVDDENFWMICGSGRQRRAAEIRDCQKKGKIEVCASNGLHVRRCARSYWFPCPASRVHRNPRRQLLLNRRQKRRQL